MNTVLSAFKSSKSDGSTPSVGKTRLIIAPDNNSSYENLRHIREIGSSSKMNAFAEDDASDLRTAKCLISSQSAAIVDTNIAKHSSATTTTTTTTGGDEVDHDISKGKQLSVNECQCEENHVKNPVSNGLVMPMDSLLANAPATRSRPPRLSTSSSAKKDEHRADSCESSALPVATAQPENIELLRQASDEIVSSENGEMVAENSLEKANNQNRNLHTPVLSAATNRQTGKCSDSSSTIPNENNSSRFHKRLSLTGIGSSPLPSVHGRSISTNDGAACNGAKRTRASTHQRNLSLDFR